MLIIVLILLSLVVNVGRADCSGKHLFDQQKSKKDRAKNMTEIKVLHETCTNNITPKRSA